MLILEGYDVVVVDNLTTGNSRLCVDVPLFIGDIADRSVLTQALQGVDAVIHLAASAYVAESIKHPEMYFRNNVAATLQLLEGILKCAVPYFIFSSSCACMEIQRHFQSSSRRRWCP
jgi:UDP-glucose 4-epimerase